MKKSFAYLLAVLVSVSAAQAAKPVDIGHLPAGVQQTIKQQSGEVKKIKTSRENGRTVYEVEFKGGDEDLVRIAEDGSVVSDRQGPGKGKGKGKAKGHYKNNRDEAEDQKSSAGSTQAQTPAQAPSTPPAAAPQAPAPTPAVVPAPAQPAPKAPASATVTPRSAAEVKTEMTQRISRINKLDNDEAMAKAGLTLISKETGVPVAALQAQRKAHPVGTGGLLVCNEIAKTTGKPVSTFLNQRLQQRDWERIATENKFDLATVLPKLERVEQGMLAARKPARK